MNSETKSLLTYLNNQRAHVLGILDGLDDETLRRPILPSGWSCLGLIQHLALDVERFWFRAVVAGEPQVIDELNANPSSAWIVEPQTSVAETIALYRQEAEFTNEIIRITPLDAAPRWWPVSQFGDWRLPDLRHILLHTMTETAGHAGHLDVVRELIDGRQWMVLT